MVHNVIFISPVFSDFFLVTKNTNTLIEKKNSKMRFHKKAVSVSKLTVKAVVCFPNMLGTRVRDMEL